MAFVQSLGISTPSAIPMLVSEGILPPEPAASSYTWRTFAIGSGGYKAAGSAFEELLYTKTCVAWSRGGLLRKLYKFDAENEGVTGVIFAKFYGDSLGFNKHLKHESEDLGDSKKQSELIVKKRKPSAPFDTPGNIPGGSRKEDDRGTANTKGHDERTADGYKGGKGRALVVFLKTQAHIYFLSGTHHLVHLPFDVASAFPLPSGILLQRTTSAPVIPQIPTAPANSFAASFSNPPGRLPQPQLFDVNGSTGFNDCPPVLSTMLDSVFGNKTKQGETGLQSLFFLSDPLAELDVVVESKPRESFNTSSREKRIDQTRKLDPDERVIYVSTEEEFQHLRVGAADPGSLILLAVTTNVMTGQFSIWKITESPPYSQPSGKRLPSMVTSGTASKRRSSFGPTTGATTPAIRNSMGPRESFGQYKDTSGESIVQDDFDLAATLDPSFEHQGATLKSNRRISSLLARSSNRDTSNLADLSSSQAQNKGTRRGPSFGSHIRKSFGRRNVNTSQTENEDPYLHISPGNSTDQSDSEDESKMPNYGQRCKSKSQSHMTFSMVHSFGGTSVSSFPSQKNAESKSPEVFSISTPKNSQIHNSQFVLCIIDRTARQLSLVHLKLTGRSIGVKKSGGTSQAGVDIQVTDITSSQDVLDACKVSEGSLCRIIALKDNGGLPQLSLQSPWSAQVAIKLPSIFLINNPFDHTTIPARKRDGGFKRVLSEGPDSVVSLHGSPSAGQFEIRDSTGAMHRVQIRIEPASQLVRKALGVCEFVIPEAGKEKEPLLRAWLAVVAWLPQSVDDADNIEWKSFVIVLFSMFIGFLSGPSMKTIRSRRKGGLLRSSSGANTDQESFEKMMDRECPQAVASPSWLQQSCWNWMSESTSSIDKASRSSKTTGRLSGDPVIGSSPTLAKKVNTLSEMMDLAKEFVASDLGISALGPQGYLPTAESMETSARTMALPTILLALHLLREEFKLDVLASHELQALTPILAQMGGWLDWDDWGWGPSSFYMLEEVDMERWIFNDASMSISKDLHQPISPPAILEYIESINNRVVGKSYPTLIDISATTRNGGLSQYTPRTLMVLELLKLHDRNSKSFLCRIGDSGLDTLTLDTLPEGVAAPIRSVLAMYQMKANTGTSFPRELLEMIDRSDIGMLSQYETPSKPQIKAQDFMPHEAIRDFHAICQSILEPEQTSPYDGSAEMDRQAVTRMVYKDDQRFAEAAKLVHPLKPANAVCYPEPDWSDTELLDAHQEIAKVVAIRTLSVSAGRSMLFYSARYPLLTEKFPIHGFSLSCVIKPGNTTVTAEKSIYTEEKVSWAFFHAGVEAGLSISKDAKGIDTSWILFNKPLELNNRHAGFLLALGLNGHLKSIAKWVAFKYLTPKHTMTSIGLLLGLAASYIGTMDTLITRLLSVHVTRMLPPGAAELNLSPLTQTTGIMAIGLLYCNTQHRRMSEVMLSEMENIDQDENISPMDNLRDEGYRLAAGFALGFINLGQGTKLKGLRDMRIVERLLGLAVATKRVDLVHILDKATAAATVAVALIFMKTEDVALAKKIDIPDTTHQFEYVRPDIFLLRTVARHLIMWNGISPTFDWIREQLPPSLKDQSKFGQYTYLHSEQLPLFNIIAGLCLSIGLRFAGTARQDVRDILVYYLDCFMRITATVGTSYDEKLTRITTRNCQDVVALAAASVMAGTGDICLFRRLRMLHGRTDSDTPYGSHLAAHQAIGVLFLGGGTHTFGTSNLAVASLLCAFYPLFPTAVLDNKSHLQAFRHFWVMACEPRCLVVRNVVSCRPLAFQVLIVLDSGERLEARAPCLLPSLDTITRIESNDSRYWPVVLDFAGDSSHRVAFARHQSLFVRRRGAYDASATIFGTAVRALNETAMAHQIGKRSFEWIFSLSSFQTFDRAERTLVLPADDSAFIYSSSRSTSVDARLVFETAYLESGRAERLWDIRVLFAWASKMAREGGELHWLGQEVLHALQAKVALLGTKPEI